MNSPAEIAQELDRLTRELNETREQQTAVSDILRVISNSPGDVEPVFELVAAHAARICEAPFANIVVVEGDTMRPVASFGGLAAVAETVALDRTTVMGRSICDQQPIHIADPLAAQSDFPHGRELALRFGHRSILAVPLIHEGRALGTIVIRRLEVRPFEDKHIALLKTFADQAAIAIENARLLNELRTARSEDLTSARAQLDATAGLLRVMSRSKFALQPVLDALVQSAALLCGANNAFMFLRDGDVYRMAAAHDLEAEFVAYQQRMGRLAIAPGRGTLVGRTALEAKMVHIPDVVEDPEYEWPTSQKVGGYRTMLGIPLLRDASVVGVIALMRTSVKAFTASQIALVTLFADQAVIAIDNVSLFDNLEARTRELAQSLQDLRTAQDRLVQSEKLASLGQLTAGIAHEIKNPLNFVNNFSGVSVELIEELQQALQRVQADEETRAEISELTSMLRGNLDKIVQHGTRADSIVKNMLLHSREGSGEHRPADINAIVEESMNLAYHGARAEKQGFNITLEKDLDPAAGEVDVFPQEITRVLLNLISNGFYAATKRKTDGNGGGAYEPILLAATKNLGDRVEIRIRDNGTGIPPEVKDKMFNPFFTTKPAGEGTGLGLSLSHDIVVKQHAGSIEVDTKAGEYTEFRITLPRKAAFLGTKGA
jgi:two-component system, NtrC family, sensor kinase